jgi:hypothetical protein
VEEVVDEIHLLVHLVDLAVVVLTVVSEDQELQIKVEMEAVFLVVHLEVLVVVELILLVVMLLLVQILVLEVMVEQVYHL